MTIQNMVDWLRGFSNGTVARENIKMINSWLIDDNEGNRGNIHSPKEDNLDVDYTCAIHTEINAINIHIFHNNIDVTHPNGGGNIDLRFIPKNTVIIESAIIDKRN